MLCDNLKKLRTAKGLSQEELAIKLNVVRQTVSKWEKGLSVPDCEMLIRISQSLDAPVSVLLGTSVEESEAEELRAIAAKLELLNEQFAARSERRRKIWRIIFFAALVFCAAAFLFEIIGHIWGLCMMNTLHTNTAIIGGADGPTAIFISSGSFDIRAFIIATAGIAVSLFGLYKLRKH